jgi:hypothetical protein
VRKAKTKAAGEWPNMLSHWWRTPSAQAAMARAKQKKRESLNKFLTSLKDKKERIAREAMDWEVVA